ncbi:Hpt domain-containing protein [Butyrivibrio sp. ob235]|uniref:Hpt domain-containing protein n=1 Tax=Butyrivibrio sp. ob235 TaxID=1761780 RepID=UPI0008BD7864|nr:Hpt domain-containing protein [Butyrivibrio sp. ob235]SEM40705.1 Hpt domain-containing protein [Butyrivibrio sp. ob235]
MLTIDILNEFGADTKEGLARCLDDEEFYLDLIPEALERERYEELQELLEKKDIPAAFEAAHALKGVLGNLALTPIYEPASEMTELLRAGEDIDYTELITTVIEQRDKLAEMIE